MQIKQSLYYGNSCSKIEVILDYIVITFYMTGEQYYKYLNGHIFDLTLDRVKELYNIKSIQHTVTWTIQNQIEAWENKNFMFKRDNNGVLVTYKKNHDYIFINVLDLNEDKFRFTKKEFNKYKKIIKERIMLSTAETLKLDVDWSDMISSF